MHCPRTSRLEAHILAHTLTLIASLLAVLMMLWHISTAHLIENYGMPREWDDAYLAAQFPGWRIGLWILLFFMIPIDSLHALLALDFHAACLYHRGPDRTIHTPGAVKALLATARRPPKDQVKQRKASSVHRQPSDNDTNTTSTSNQPPLPEIEPRTYHPLYYCTYHPRTRLILLTIYDTLLLLLLTTHIYSFLAYLGPNLSYCTYEPPYPAQFADEQHTNISIHDRCVRINIDGWISGGFDMGLSFVLLGLHVWHLVFRGWEYVKYGPAKRHRGDVGGLGEDLEGGGVGVPADVPVDTASHPNSDTHANVDVEGKAGTSTVRRRWRSKRTSEGKEGSKWSEALFECLVGAK